MLFINFRLGARSLTLTHNCNNPWADSSLVDKEGNMPVHNGLTPFGKVGEVTHCKAAAVINFLKSSLLIVIHYTKSLLIVIVQYT